MPEYFDSNKELTRMEKLALEPWFAGGATLLFVSPIIAFIFYLGNVKQPIKEQETPEPAPKVELASPALTVSEKEPEVTTKWKDKLLAERLQRELAEKQPSEPTP